MEGRQLRVQPAECELLNVVRGLSLQLLLVK